MNDGSFLPMLIILLGIVIGLIVGAARQTFDRYHEVIWWPFFARRSWFPPIKFLRTNRNDMSWYDVYEWFLNIGPMEIRRLRK